MTIAGADSTGIRKVAIRRNGVDVVSRVASGAAAGGCASLNSGIAFTYVDPCGGARGVNGDQDLVLDTRSLPDGTSQIEAAVFDTVGNGAAETRTVKVDNEPPPAPAPVTDQAWSSEGTATWTWAVPPESDRAPVVGMDVERCVGADCVVEQIAGAGFGEPVAHTRAVAEGVSGLRVRSRDAAGNVGQWSAVSFAHRDRTGPLVAVEVPERVEEGQAVGWTVHASDALSGVGGIEREFRTDGGPWLAAEEAVSARAGQTLRFRSRATDLAGNASPWSESRDVSVVAAGPAQAAPDAATVIPAPPPETASGLPVAAPPRSTRITSLRASRRGRTAIRLTGRVRPATATGAVLLRHRSRGRTVLRSAPLRPGGRFVIRVPARPVASSHRHARRTRRSLRGTLVYRGDGAHRPARRTVRLRVRAARRATTTRRTDAPTTHRIPRARTARA